MAEEIVDQVVTLLQEEMGILYTNSMTKTLPLSGGEVGGSSGFRTFIQQKKEEAADLGIPMDDALHLIHRYGSNVDHLFEHYLSGKRDAEARKIKPCLFAELNYTMECEAVTTPSDFFIRRTGMLYFAMEELKNTKDQVIDYMQDHFQWSTDVADEYRRELHVRMTAATSFPE